jgi:N-ethylmaleimide reductase
LVPGPFAAEYYAQRASAGLIIAEATQISAQAQGYANTPGCYSDDQVRGWKRVTDAVHAKGGTIVVQLWHTGRVSHTSFQKDGQAPVGPSAIRADTKTFVAGQGFVDASMPRALELDEIPAIINDFRHAATRAIEAGFDGVELHGAHGYLLDAFMRDGTNHRTDAYGGSIENRCRLTLEVVDAITKILPPGRVGIRLSPVSPANDVSDSAPQAVFDYLVGQLDARKLGYIHLVEGATGGPRDIAPFDFAALRKAFHGAYVANNSYDRALATQAVATGAADLIAFGRPFISNPDLVERLRRDAPLNALDVKTLYGGGAEGYTDYPALTA